MSPPNDRLGKIMHFGPNPWSNKRTKCSAWARCLGVSGDCNAARHALNRRTGPQSQERISTLVLWRPHDQAVVAIIAVGGDLDVIAAAGRRFKCIAGIAARRRVLYQTLFALVWIIDRDLWRKSSRAIFQHDNEVALAGSFERIEVDIIVIHDPGLDDLTDCDGRSLEDGVVRLVPVVGPSRLHREPV